MDLPRVRRLLRDLSRGVLDVDTALAALKRLGVESIDHPSLPRGTTPAVRFDHHRELRTGIPEAVFGQGKDRGTLAELLRRAIASKRRLLVTRVDPDDGAALAREIPEVRHLAAARCLVAGRTRPAARSGGIALLAAGTTDLPVAEEAAETAIFLGRRVVRRYDVGVAGLHRVVSVLPDLAGCRVIIAVAGLEGALPSVVAGLVDLPVVAVPTSVGYGAAFSGLAPLLAMMNSCAPGIGVVNIDNGFGGAVLAAKIDRGGHGGRHRPA